MRDRAATTRADATPPPIGRMGSKLEVAEGVLDCRGRLLGCVRVAQPSCIAIGHGHRAGRANRSARTENAKEMAFGGAMFFHVDHPETRCV